MNVPMQVLGSFFAFPLHACSLSVALFPLYSLYRRPVPFGRDPVGYIFPVLFSNDLAPRAPMAPVFRTSPITALVCNFTPIGRERLSVAFFLVFLPSRPSDILTSVFAPAPVCRTCASLAAFFLQILCRRPVVRSRAFPFSQGRLCDLFSSRRA